jgi:hypothetical protein
LANELTWYNLLRRFHFPKGCRSSVLEALVRALKSRTRAFGPNHPDIPTAFQANGQRVLSGWTARHQAAAPESEARSFGSPCLSRRRAQKKSRHQARSIGEAAK